MHKGVDGKFYIKQEKNIFAGRKGENKPSDPKNGIISTRE
jgi:hypothetical protein